MITINRIDGTVTGELTQAQRNALWETLVRSQGPAVLKDMVEKKAAGASNE